MINPMQLNSLRPQVGDHLQVLLLVEEEATRHRNQSLGPHGIMMNHLAIPVYTSFPPSVTVTHPG